MSKKKVSLLAAAAAFVLIAALFAGYFLTMRSRGENVPKITLPEYGSGQPTPGNTDGSNNISNNQFEKIKIDHDNVQNVIATMQRPDSCFYHVTVTTFYDDTSRTDQFDHYRKNGYTKTIKYKKSGSPEKNVITGKSLVFIWKEGDARYYKGNLGESTPDDVQMIPTYEDIALYKKEDILKAEMTELDGQKCIYVETLDSKMNYKERFWVSLSTGILINCETLSGDRTVYSMSVSGFQSNEVLDGVFLLPNGVSALNVQP